MLKETLKELLEILNKETGKTASDVALEMGYKKNYISEMLTPKGKVTLKFLTAFKSKYRDDLDNPKWILNEDEQKYISKSQLEIEYLKKRIEDLERLNAAKDLIISTLKNESPPLKRLGGR